MKMQKICLALGVSAVLSASSAWAVGDAKKGVDVFAEECGDCHSVVPGKNKKGPSLAGLNGRKAGSIADFSGYSEAMKQSGITWAPEKIDAYIAQPKKIVAGGKMKYDGLAESASRADVIAYLMSLK
ncbi:c-type cytochrome [Azonexus sp. IMCC34842]|uniref:c-type cytochrome n=1 Tax=Azonexus sp. IMCC34842 TaxID=3420950 RepID=UPI003D13393F